eukprot:5749254-Pleurochrysis_carterae.AAC.2
MRRHASATAAPRMSEAHPDPRFARYAALRSSIARVTPAALKTSGKREARETELDRASALAPDRSVGILRFPRRGRRRGKAQAPAPVLPPPPQQPRPPRALRSPASIMTHAPQARPSKAASHEAKS